MINQDRPLPTTDTKLNIGSAFNLVIGGVYSLLIGSGGGGFSNTDKASIGETWSSIETTWATETKTWLASSQLIDNTSKPTGSITNESKPA